MMSQTAVCHYQYPLVSLLCHHLIISNLYSVLGLECSDFLLLERSFPSRAHAPGYITGNGECQTTRVQKVIRKRSLQRKLLNLQIP